MAGASCTSLGPGSLWYPWFRCLESNTPPGAPPFTDLPPPWAPCSPPALPTQVEREKLRSHEDTVRLSAEKGHLGRTLTGAELELAEAQRQIQLLEVPALDTCCPPNPRPHPHPSLRAGLSQELLTAQPAQSPQAVSPGVGVVGGSSE